MLDIMSYWASVGPSTPLFSFIIRPQMCKRLQQLFAPEEYEVDADLLLEKLQQIRADELWREVENRPKIAPEMAARKSKPCSQGCRN